MLTLVGFEYGQRKLINYISIIDKIPSKRSFLNIEDIVYFSAAPPPLFGWREKEKKKKANVKQ